MFYGGWHLSLLGGVQSWGNCVAGFLFLDFPSPWRFP